VTERLRRARHPCPEAVLNGPLIDIGVRSLLPTP
jgi:hypothetical protein